MSIYGYIYIEKQKKDLYRAIDKDRSLGSRPKEGQVGRERVSVNIYKYCVAKCCKVLQSVAKLCCTRHPIMPAVFSQKNTVSSSGKASKNCFTPSCGLMAQKLYAAAF
jgi:hypothetical protein